MAKSDAEKLQDEIAAKEAELEKIKYNAWIDGLVHPKPKKRTYWKELPYKKGEPKREWVEETYTPTTEEVIGDYIKSGGDSNFEIHLPNISRIIATDCPELAPHIAVLTKYLEWIHKDRIVTSEADRWFPLMSKYGLIVGRGKNTFQRVEQKTCPMCRRLYFNPAEVICITTMEYNESGYEADHGSTSYNIYVTKDTDTREAVQIRLLCDPKAFGDRIAELATAIEIVPPNMTPKEIASWYHKTAEELNKLTKMQEKKDYTIPMPMECLDSGFAVCTECFASPNFAVLQYPTHFRWIIPDMIRIVKKDDQHGR